MALIGGGNSVKTVSHDYDCVKKTPIVMLDHYFREDDDKMAPNDAYFGVNKIWEKLKGNKDIRKHVLPSGDKVKEGGFTHFMIVLNDKNLPNIPADLQRVPIVVNPRDCVPKDYIRNNIKDNMKLIPKDKFIEKCRTHTDHAIIISGGPNIDYKKLKETLDKQINEEINKAEKEIELLKKSAPDKIKKIAIETSSELVKKLIGTVKIVSIS